MNIKGCLSSNSVHWATPNELYKKFMSGGHIDPCPYHSVENGLLYNYSNAKIYVNPPFKDLNIWVDWIIKQVENLCTVWLLMPSRTDTKYFAKVFPLISDIYFFKGRLKYNDGKGVSPFPTMLLRIVNKEPYEDPIAHSLTVEEFIKEVSL